MEKPLSPDASGTGERIKVPYRIVDYYQRDVLQTLNYSMRDHHTGEATVFDPRLFDLLYDIECRLGYPGPIEIPSAYRSPRTNGQTAQGLAAGRGRAQQPAHVRQGGRHPLARLLHQMGARFRSLLAPGWRRLLP